MEEPLLVPTWALVAATAGLVLATIGLGIVAWLQWQESKAARAETKRQADVAEQSLEVSRLVLRHAEADRRAASPMPLKIVLKESLAGSADLYFANDSRDAVMVLSWVRVIEAPGAMLVEEFLAEGTLGINEGWSLHLTWDATHVGNTLIVEAFGRRVGGPEVSQEFRYRIDSAGRLADLLAKSALVSWG